MRRSDPISKALPRWVTILLLTLPGGGTAATLVLLDLLNGRNGRIQLFNLSPKDSFLVAFIGAVLVFSVLALLIYCFALMRALLRALQESMRS